MGSQSLYRACWATSPLLTPLLYRRCSHRPPARQPPPAHTAPRPGTPVPPHALRACSPALPRQFRRTPSPRAPPRRHTRIRRMPSPRAHAPRSADVATTATPLLPHNPRWPESVPGRVSQPNSPGSHSLDHSCPIIWLAFVSYPHSGQGDRRGDRGLEIDLIWFLTAERHSFIGRFATLSNQSHVPECTYHIFL